MLLYSWCNIMYRDLPYYEGPKHAVNISFMKISMKIMQTIHTFITWSQFIVSTRSKHWLIRHSMVFTAIYSSHDSDIPYNGLISNEFNFRNIRKTLFVQKLNSSNIIFTCVRPRGGNYHNRFFSLSWDLARDYVSIAVLCDGFTSIF